MSIRFQTACFATTVVAIGLLAHATADDARLSNRPVSSKPSDCAVIELELTYLTVADSMLEQLIADDRSLGKKLEHIGPDMKEPICLDKPQLVTIFRAAQLDMRSDIVPTPRFRLLNGQTTDVFLRDKPGFFVGIQIRVNGQAYPKPEFVETGLRIVARASASEDRKQVALELKVRQTELDREGVMVPVNTQLKVEGKVDETVSYTFHVSQPQAKTFIDLDRSYKLSDGQPVILGAWKKTKQVRVVNCGPPILRDIPIVNLLFEDERYEPENHVVLLLATPRVVVNEGQR